MVQDRTNLPEGTDKIVPGASDRAGQAGSRGGGRTGGEDVIVTETTIVAEMEVPAPDSPDVERPFAGSGSSTGGTASGGKQGRGSSSGNGDRSEKGSTRTGGKILDTVRSGRDKLAGEAAGKTRDFVGQGLDRSGEALSNISRLVGDTAPGLEERLGPEYADYARRAADAIDSTAQKLRSKDPDELIDDTRNFVRKSPGMALAGAAIVGFALARLVKTGLDSGSDRESGESGGRRS